MNRTPTSENRRGRYKKGTGWGVPRDPKGDQGNKQRHEAVMNYMLVR